MTANRLMFTLYIAAVLAGVASWTVDLEAVRRFFDNQKRHEEYQQHLNNYYGEEFEEYDSPVDGQRGQYAEEYGYEGYMERKVHGIVRKGGKYLDGLRLAIESYKQTLENCSGFDFPQAEITNSTESQGNLSAVPGLDFQWPQTLNLTSSMLGSNSILPVNLTWQPWGETGNLSASELLRLRCANATREREHVRRLADLALHTTRQLQDRAVKEMIYAGHPGHDGEEKELIIRLAWFLDRLAHITGYEPDAKVYTDETEGGSSTPGPAPLSLAEGARRQMIECVRHNASLPAALRCSFPFRLPPLLMMTLNVSDENSTSQNTSAASGRQRATPEALPSGDQAMDPEVQASNLLETLLIVTDMWAKVPPSKPAKTVHKRSAREPLREFIDYYMKQKAWVGDNARDIPTGQPNVDNHLQSTRSIQKRSDINQRYLLRLPKDPYHDGISYNNYRSGLQPGTRLVDKLTKYYIKPHTGISKSVRKLGKTVKFVPRSSFSKRSVLQENPMQDISDHVKNKPGTNIKPSVTGALHARVQLERIFRTGSAEAQRRYGSNYNPLVPSPFYAGVIKTIADI